jgi:hypothetical protein
MRFPIPACQDVHASVTDLMEGALPWHRRLLLRVHLLFCDACRPVYQVFTRLRKEGPVLLAPPAEAPKEAKAALKDTLARIREEKGKE